MIETAERFVEYRNYKNPEGADGLDSMRHNLRMLRQCNLEDTRLIVCSMEGENNYPDIDKLLTEDEFAGYARQGRQYGGARIPRSLHGQQPGGFLPEALMNAAKGQKCRAELNHLSHITTERCGRASTGRMRSALHMATLLTGEGGITFMAKYDTIVFDFDGVVADTARTSSIACEW